MRAALVVAAWAALGVAGWLAVATVVGLMIGRGIRLADRNTRTRPAEVDPVEVEDVGLDLLEDAPVDDVTVEEVDRRFWGLVTVVRRGVPS